MSQHEGSYVFAPNENKKYCAFRISDHLFGVDVLDVREIKTHGGITPIPHASDSVLGYLNLRSQINLIVGLRRLCRIGDAPLDEKTRIIYFKHVIAEPFGILVDKIEDICEVADEDIEFFDSHITHDEKIDGIAQALDQKAALSDVKGFRNTMDFAIISGICRLPRELMLILDSHKILDAANRIAA